MSELNCCKRCGAYLTCDHKGECCVECDYFDPVDMICLAGPEKKPANTLRPKTVNNGDDIDPATFLFEDDDEEEDISDLPPERDAEADDDSFDEDEDEEEEEEDFDFEEEDDDW